MAIIIPRGKKDDATLQTILGALKKYEAEHPKAKIALYRQDSVSVRVRVIDPAFQGIGRPERHARVWHYLEPLPEDALADLSMIVLLTPEEKKTSFANQEFEDPVPSPF